MKKHNSSSGRGAADAAPDEIRNLEPPDSHYLSSAEGWLELGDRKEARDEFEKLSSKGKNHWEALIFQWKILSEENEWIKCVEVGGRFVAEYPQMRNGWILRSYALHALKRTQEAFDLLLPVVDKFPDSCNIPFNLACYCAQLGSLKEARIWLDKASVVDADYVNRKAKNDPDLKPLWETAD